jgi:hypothetical protein
VYAAAAGLVIALGLGSRAEAVPLPPAARDAAGGALWALLVFVGLGLLLPRARTAAVAGLAAGVAAAVECSQLYRAPWADALRGTALGRLALGDTFDWGDLPAYLLGIAVGAAAEWGAGRWRNQRRAV